MILVTGATGNVGGELVPQLLAKEQSVRVMTRDARKVAGLPANVEVVIGDFDRPDTLLPAMQGVEKLFLITNEIGAQHVAAAVSAAQEAGVKHIVYLSSLGAEDPDVAIGRWHIERETYVCSSGISWTILRPGGFMSNAMQWVRSIKTQGVVYTSAQFPFNPIDPYDIAAVAALSLTEPGHEGKVYDLTGDDVLTTTDQVETLSKLLDKPIQLVEVPSAAVREGMLRGGLDPVLVDAIIELSDKVATNGTVFHSRTIEELLGRPPHTFTQWCEAHRAAYQ